MAVESRNIEVHKFTIKPYGKDKEPIVLESDTFSFYKLLVEQLKAFLIKRASDEKRNKENEDVNIHKKVMTIAFDVKNKGLENEEIIPLWKEEFNAKIISGKVSEGKFGETGLVKTIKDGKMVTIFDIESHHAVTKPFYFKIIISNNKKFGFIFLERNGQSGVKGLFTGILKSFVKEKTEKLKFQDSQFSDKDTVRAFVEKGGLKSITMVHNTLASNIEDQIDGANLITQEVELTLTIKTKKGGVFSSGYNKRALKIFENSYGSFFTNSNINGLGFNDSSVTKVESEYNGSNRSIDLSDTMKFKPYYKVSVKIDSNGHSNFESIDKAVLSLAKELLGEIY